MALSGLIASVAGISVASCGGSHEASIATVSSGSLPTVVLPSPTAGRTARVSLSFALPAQIAQFGQRRRVQFISPSNTQLRIAVTPLGGSTTNYGPAACTAGSCAVSFSASPGATTIAFTLTDNGGIVLSTFSTVTIIQPDALNTLKFSANPVVDSVALTLAGASVVAGTPSDTMLTVSAKDFAGNTIVGNDQYVDANGTPVSFTFKVENVRQGGRGSIVLRGATRVTAAGQAPVYLHYDGNWVDHADIAVVPSSASVTVSGGTTLATVPHAVEYAVGVNPVGITSGPDGNLWFTLFNDTKIGKITTSGAYTPYPCTPCVQPYYIATGPDGYLWFSEDAGYIDKMSTAGAFTRVATAGGAAVRMLAGPDGNMWYSTETNGVIGKVTAKGAVTNYAISGASHALGFGPDGSAWYIPSGGTTLGKMSLNGNILKLYTIPTPGVYSEGIVTGPDGNVWFANYGSSLIEKITAAGVITPYALQTGANPRDLIVGPDGNLWFTETGTGTIGKVTTSGTVTEYGITYGISSGAAPIGITTGPDGNIWFAELGTNKVAKFIL